MFTDPMTLQNVSWAAGVITTSGDRVFRLIDLAPSKTVRKYGASDYLTLSHVEDKDGRRRSLLRRDTLVTVGEVSEKASAYLVLDKPALMTTAQAVNLISQLAALVLEIEALNTGSDSSAGADPATGFDLYRWVDGEP
jgi:hypothetical protein